MSDKATIALYSGLIVSGDAVSSSLRAKLAAIRMARMRGIPVEAVAFCQHTDVYDPAIQVVPGLPELLASPAFHRADLHVFEFGIAYQLFNVAHLLPSERMASVYHNITPKELVLDPVVQTAIERSLDQKHLLARMAHVACISEFSRQELVAFGIAPERMSVLPLPVSVEGPLPSPREERSSSDPVRFLYVGRLVKAKGVLDLLTATRLLVGAGVDGVELCLIGRMDSSDSQTTTAIEQALHDDSLSTVLRFCPNASPEALNAAYRDADVFVMPSYHEGYCVPIVEALQARCPVIAYDNSNIPFVSAGLAKLVPTGDVAALVQQMRQAVAALRTAREDGGNYRIATENGPIPEKEWRALAQGRVSGLRAMHDDGFVALIQRLLDTSTRKVSVAA